MNQRKSIAFIGAGPACLTSAYHLAKSGYQNLMIFEQDPEFLGGLSRTISYEGYLFDIGGHRFFSKSKKVRDLWHEILPDDFIVRKRKSRIYYNGKFFHYPLRPFQALKSLGMIEACLCVFSYCQVKLFPIQKIETFEDWVCNQFGRRLFRIFFKTYTEKVWGMKCEEISSDWAAQRIKNLSLFRAVFDSFRRKSSGEIQSLIDEFHYPVRGPGMMWDTCGKKIELMGGTIHRNHKVIGLKKLDDGSWEITTKNDGKIQQYHAETIVSSLDLSSLVKYIEPELPVPIKHAGEALRYRDFLMVALIIEDNGDIFDDQWLYIHGPEVKVGRIQNFKSWSPQMVPREDETCLGMEYFCFEGDELWNLDEESIMEMAIKELNLLRLINGNKIKKAKVIKQKKAYPVYDENYQKHLDDIKEHINQSFENLFTIGRNGMHQYNNQDHAMMTGLLVANNIIEGHARYNHWQVNQQAEYLENPIEEDFGMRMVPRVHNQ